MEVLTENIITYSFIAVLLVSIVYFYIRKQQRNSKIVEKKIEIAKKEGLYEPFSLHPVVDANSCIQTGACVKACLEEDVLGILNGKATTINASRCVGHGACFQACPTQAITLYIGTETRGVDLPHVDVTFESNVPGIYIAGEMGGMGLIRNAVEQGKQAVENLAMKIDQKIEADYDLVIVGAGPAGISASLAAKKLNLSSLTLEQDTLGGTVYTFPRSKIVMTAPMDIPLHGKVKLFETTKTELLNLWNDVLGKNQIQVKEQAKVESIIMQKNKFLVETASNEQFTARKILLTVGRRGSPRKLNIPGEMSDKVAYRLLEPELIENKKIVVVGGGDSAVETALLLADQNQVTLSYRGDVFNRLKPANSHRMKDAMSQHKVDVRFNTSVKSIDADHVKITNLISEEVAVLENDLVYIFAGGELPTEFLKKVGIKITKKFGEAILKHK